MLDVRHLAHQLRKLLPSQIQEALWQSQIAIGNRNIRALGQHIDREIAAAYQRDLEFGTRMRTRSEWEHFRDKRMGALRRVHDINPQTTMPLAPSITHTLEANTFRIDNLVFNSRSGTIVTANLYRPRKVHTGKSPGIIVSHGHHYPKTQDELQCLGITLAQSGCFVLIMDMLGHGERRQHPFSSAEDYPDSFSVDSQDYYSRNILGIQLDLVGASLAGWMSGDLSRGVDLLLTDPCIDPNRIILVGGVADGGDLAAIAGALDSRVAGVAAFNFSERPVGDWNPTGCLAQTARYGFWPWVILASIAPRKLIYGREFAWNPHSDPVWQLLLKTYDLYDARDCLRFIHGTGAATGQTPMDSHCNNIGTLHRQQLYPILEEWFGIPISEVECPVRYSADELKSLKGLNTEQYKPRPLYELAQEMSFARLATARGNRAIQPQTRQLERLQEDITNVAGLMSPTAITAIRSRPALVGKQEQVDLEIDGKVLVNLHLFWPSQSSRIPSPVVIGLAQEGNRRLRHDRRELIAQLRQSGATVCLVELRGVGDGRHGELYRGRISPSAEVASASMALGESLTISRLRDLRSVIGYLKTRNEVNSKRMALWGDSLAPANSRAMALAAPFDADKRPALGEPLGGVVALLGGAFEPEIKALYIQGGLTSYASLLDNSFLYQPPDSIIPGFLSTADLCDLAAALVPRPFRMEGLVDGCNRRATHAEVEQAFESALRAYEKAGMPQHLRIDIEPHTPEQISTWLLGALTT